MDKTAIRNLCIERRTDLSPRQVRVKSIRINSRLKSVINWPIVRSLHVYQSVDAWNEVGTNELVAYIKRTWPHIKVTVGEAKKRAELPDTTFDVIIMPVLAFDKNLNRLGYGGGWYDRFLEHQTNSLKIGLAFHCQRVEAVPVHSHDIRMDIVVTERVVIKK